MSEKNQQKGIEQAQKQLSEQFKPDQHVYYIPKKLKSVVKFVDDNLNKIYISFHPRGSKYPRMNKWVNADEVKVWLNPEERKKKKVLALKNKSYDGIKNRYYLAVKDFHETFKQSLPTAPTPMSAEQALIRMSWDLEETMEMLHASSDSIAQFAKLYDELMVKAYEVFLKLTSEPLPENKLIAQADALVDKLYFNQGDFTLVGLKPDYIFDAVQRSNMSKLWDDGEPRFRESDGKIIKPENWVSPDEDIKKEIDRQIKMASKK